MNFDLTLEQQALADSVARFAEREYGWEERVKVIRSDFGLNPAHWNTFAELGWLGAGLSEEAGGFGGGPVENAVIAEQLGRNLVTEPFAAHVVVAQLLSRLPAGPAASLLEPLLMGEERIAIGLHEPEQRGDIRSLSTRYEIAPGGYRLRGLKSLVEAVEFSGSILIAATGDRGLSVFRVQSDAEGLARRDYRLLDSHRVSDLKFDVLVPEDALLGCGAPVEEAFDAAIDHGSLAVCAEALGAMEAALWQTRDYLKTRKQFGVALSTFQALQHRMADILIEVEMTRSLLYHALGAIEGDPSRRNAAVSALKVQVAKGGLLVGKEAIQLHGGIGVTEELPISHYYRRLYVIARLLGDIDFHIDRFSAAVDEGDPG